MFNDFIYEVDNLNGDYAVITGYMGNDKILNIPSHINGLPVQGISNKAFASSDIKEVFIPEGIARIGSEAFCSCKSLEAVNFPSSLLLIDKRAFMGCLKLKKVNFKEGLRYIRDLAFANCNIQSLVCPNSIVTIGPFAFEDASVINIDLGSGVKRICADAFNGCFFKSVKIPDSVSFIGAGAFDNCEYLNKIHIGKKVKELDSFMSLFEGRSSLETVTIDENNVNYRVINNVLYGKSNVLKDQFDVLLRFPSVTHLNSFEIPADVNDISVGAATELVKNIKHPLLIKFLNSKIDSRCLADSGFFNTEKRNLITIAASIDSEVHDFCEINDIKHRPLMSEMEAFFNKMSKVDLKSIVKNDKIL